MRIQITYETNADAEYPCCARTEIQGKGYFGIGKTWEQAKENLLKKVAVLGNAVPAPETVEVKMADEEMQTDFALWEKQAEQMGAAMNTMLNKITGVKE